MSDLLGSSLGLLFAVIFVVVVVRFFLLQNAQRQAELEAAEKARQVAEAERLRAAQLVAEAERLRAAQLVAEAQTRREIQEKDDAKRFWSSLGEVLVTVTLSFLDYESED